MKVNSDTIKFETDEPSSTIYVVFSYTDKSGEYSGVLDISRTNVGGMIAEDYEITWDDDKIPPNYNDKRDGHKIYELYRDSC